MWIFGKKKETLSYHHMEDVNDPIDCCCPEICPCPKGVKISQTREQVYNSDLGNASFLSITFYSWLNPLIKLATLTTLKSDDMRPFPESLQLPAVMPIFTNYWTQLREAYNRKKKANPLNADKIKFPGLFIPLFKSSLVPFLWFMFFEAFYFFVLFLQPFAIINLSAYFTEAELGNNPDIMSGIWCAIELGILALICAGATLGEVYFCQVIIVKWRSILLSAIFDKSLRVSSWSVSNLDNGAVMNLISSDTHRIINGVMFINIIWSSPIVIIATSTLLYFQLGVTALITVALMLTLFPYQLIVAYVMAYIREQTLKLTDLRIKLTNETLTGIHVIKAYAWEHPMMDKINAVRRKELRYIKLGMLVKGLNQSLIFIWPAIVVVVTIIAYNYIEGDLTEQKTMLLLSCLNVMRFPISMLPGCLTSTVELIISLNRINDYLNAEEITPRPEYPPSVGVGVGVGGDVSVGVGVGGGSVNDVFIQLYDCSLPLEMQSEEVTDIVKQHHAQSLPSLSCALSSNEFSGKTSVTNQLVESTGVETGSISTIPRDSESEGDRDRDRDRSRDRDRVRPRDTKHLAVSLNNVDFYWTSQVYTYSNTHLNTNTCSKSKNFPLPPPPVLANISLHIPSGALVGVVGKVGSGKSSLLSAILGEMHCEASEKKLGYAEWYRRNIHTIQDVWNQQRSADKTQLKLFGGLSLSKKRDYEGVDTVGATLDDLELPADVADVSADQTPREVTSRVSSNSLVTPFVYESNSTSNSTSLSKSNTWSPGNYSFTNFDSNPSHITNIEDFCVRGRIGYFPQEPWLIHASIKDNILLNKPYNERHFLLAVESAGLTGDIASFDDGVDAMVEDGGANLSGGQRARVAFARLLYRTRDVSSLNNDNSNDEGRLDDDCIDLVLMDDVLAAVDVNMGHTMFNKGVLHMLKHRGVSVVMVINSHLHFLPMCDKILILDHMDATAYSQAGVLIDDASTSSSPSLSENLSGVGLAPNEHIAEPTNHKDGEGERDKGDDVNRRPPSTIIASGSYAELVSRGFQLDDYAEEEEVEDGVGVGVGVDGVDTLSDFSDHNHFATLSLGGKSVGDRSMLTNNSLLTNSLLPPSILLNPHSAAVSTLSVSSRLSHRSRANSVLDDSHFDEDDGVGVGVGVGRGHRSGSVTEMIEMMDINDIHSLPHSRQRALSIDTHTIDLEAESHSNATTSNTSPSKSESSDSPHDHRVPTSTYIAYFQGRTNTRGVVIRLVLLLVLVVLVQVSRMLVDFSILQWSSEAGKHNSNPSDSHTSPYLSASYMSTSTSTDTPSSLSPPQSYLHSFAVESSLDGYMFSAFSTVSMNTLSTLAAPFSPSQADYYSNSNSNSNTDSYSASKWIKLSVAILCICGFLLFLRSVYLIYVVLDTAYHTHAEMLKNILFSPTSFFHNNSLGNLISRFSKDMDIIDTSIPETLLFYITDVLSLLGIITMAFVSSYILIFVFVPLAILIIYLQTVFRPSAVQVKNFELESFAPLHSTFAAATKGVSSLRAFGLGVDFSKQQIAHIANNSVCNSLYSWLNRWFAFRVDSLTAFFITIVAITCVVFVKDITPVVAGMAVTYVVQMIGMLQYTIRTSIIVEGGMVSMKRCEQYFQLPDEGDYFTNLIGNGVTANGHRINQLSHKSTDSHTAGTKSLKQSLRLGSTVQLCDPSNPPIILPDDNAVVDSQDKLSGWPKYGYICFRNLCMSYAPSLPLVLNNINLDIPNGAKVGVVGRTGAGKSTILLTLLRLTSYHGDIFIDGTNISDIGVGDLRSRVSLIPQHPVLFSGTIRYNIDPQGLYSDSQIKQVLSSLSILDDVLALPGELNFEVAEFASNLAVGFKQIICVARALLRRSSILILDEATASLDRHSDEIIQTSIRRDFAHATTITIAHRLETVVDYDYIMVLKPVKKVDCVEDDSENDVIDSASPLSSVSSPSDSYTDSIAEFAHPYTLLSDESSEFYSLAKRANYPALLNKAKEAYLKRFGTLS